MFVLIVSLICYVSWYRVSASVAWSSGHCVSLPTTPDYRLINPCAGVVNYPFYLPAGTTLQQLQQQASTALSNTVLPQLPATCVSNVVAYQCAKIYRKCYPGVNLADTNTYNHYPYAQLGLSQAIPLQRPCGSVCTAVVPSCGVLYTRVFGTPNCTAVYDYDQDAVGPYPREFDLSNNASQCYSPATVTFAGMSETYNPSPTAPCSGYVKDFLIPFASKLNSNFTMLQRPGVVQNLLNTQLSAALVAIPKDTVTPSCFDALLQFQCYSLFIRPVKQTLYQALLNGGMTTTQANGINTQMPALQLTTTKFTIPQFPPKSICLNYASTCSAILPLIKLKNAALAPNCSAVVPGTTTGALQYPTANQTVASVVVATGAPSPAPPQLTFKFITGPNPNPYYNVSQLSTTSVSYSKECPGGLGSFCTNGAAPPTWSQGQCMSFQGLPLTTRLVNPCFGVVNYPFYVPPGTTPKQLQKKASDALSKTVLLQFPADCLKNLVAYTCSKIYMKCATQDVTNTTAYDHSAYEEVNRHYGLPFQRPCESVCNGVRNTCPGIINKLYGMPTCEATVDFSIGQLPPPYPRLFDHTNDSDRCFSPRLVQVAGTTESFPVNKTFPCSGFVKEFFVPPASKINSNFTLLQLPGTVQRIINTNMKTQFDALPRFLPPPCLQALLRYQCYTLFLTSITQSLSTALMNGGLSAPQVSQIVNNPAFASFGLNSMSFTIPQFPPREVCTNYSMACAKMMPSLVAKNPSLKPNCSSTVSVAAALVPKESGSFSSSADFELLDVSEMELEIDGESGVRSAAQQFPQGDQVVTTVSVDTGLPPPLPATLTFKFTSGPNPSPYFNGSEASTIASGYTPSCPRGFVIPEHPDNDGVTMIGGTACAMACM